MLDDASGGAGGVLYRAVDCFIGWDRISWSDGEMADVPGDRKTFLFTDIEGSTALWEEFPEAMETALARHDALMRAAIEANGGHVFKTVGDAFCAVFDEAHAALTAAVSCQRALAAEPWGETGPLRVRMGLHAGDAELRDNDYFGPTLNCVARLMSAGYGGQVLLSAAVRGQIGRALPQGIGLRDFGEHRLRDLQQAVHIFQLTVPELRNDFPPIKSLEGHATNLPAQLTPLIGRAEEVAQGQALLTRSDVRLVTLTGPGGSGKTRLALQIAAELVDDFGDGAFFVPLAPIRDPQLVVPTIARTLGLREVRNLPVADQLTAYLHGKRLLLVLDNFEQLLPAAPDLTTLLASCPELTLLVTSRAALRLSGEYELPVAPLPAPDRETGCTVAAVAQSPAVDLFVQRVRALQPAFVLTDENAADVAAICARLDGLPLALELAAAKIRLLSPRALRARLDRSLRLLTAGTRDMPERHQTMRGAIAWSYDLLPSELQPLFDRLAVFAGGCTIDAAEMLLSATTPSDATLDILNGLESLVNESLLRRMDGEGGEPRLAMLETVREFGLERLAASGELDRVRQAHADYFLDLAEQLEDELTGPDDAAALERVEAERDNLRAALTWWEKRGEVECLLRLAGSLASYWDLRGRLSEGRDWLERGLAAAGDVAGPAVVKALHAAGLLALSQGDFPIAERRYQRALELSRQLGDQRAAAISLQGLGNVAFEVDDYDRAKALLQESLGAFQDFGDVHGIAAQQLILGEMASCQSRFAEAGDLLELSLAAYRQLSDERGQGLALNQLAVVALQQGEAARAAELIDASLTTFRAAGYQRGIALALTTQASLALERGEVEEAAAMLDEGTALFEALGDQEGLATARETSGRAALQVGDLAQAAASFDESFTLARASGDKRGMALALLGRAEVELRTEGGAAALAPCAESLALFRRIGDRGGVAMATALLADTWSDLGQPERAARLHAYAAALRDEIGAPLPPVGRVRREEQVARVRDVLGEERFAAAWNAGHAMTQDELARELASEIGP